MRPTQWRRSTHLIVGLGVLAVVAAVVAATALFTASGRGASGVQIPPPPPAVTAKPGIVPVSETAPVPTRPALAATLAAVVFNPDLGKFGGRVTDAMTGEELWRQSDDVALQPASTNKTLTTAAALLALDREARVTTRVVAADQPGAIVLVGGGDPTLSAAPPGWDTWYHGAARISDLADQIRRSGVSATRVEVDTSLFSGPSMAPGWDPADIEGGDIAPIESVMLDAGRIQPATDQSRRSVTPALDAGRALATALGVDPQQVSIASRPASSGARQLAAVRSAPLIERLNEMMSVSDNVMAECIAREVAASMHRPLSFAGAVDAVTNRLNAAHIDTRGADLQDSSGLSVDDRLTAETLDAVVQAAAGPDQPALRSLLDLLPIAGGSGTLSDRFLDTVATTGPAGWLRAKTGSLTATNALAGVVTDRSGRVLTFALISNGAGPTGRTAIDAVAATLWSCGCAT
ncbi:D-alanyl-D-alanine carboxypeptidase/D-alanyl-D-alanine endopeptidase [Candidatus Mycobacterium methanotrophicum]|uniref:D-alanyl-D-alanine carboxypeptidase/D-alanyl-D-alanine-endopeptidase n=1 Tax=Candidatus Mycobacterium methanotrophicum TaxID=2943498 RepID=A0ABY4QLU7_9MYCO|nr:D-alanyl-D-alanine carboxypeptidase/D-alanyl-D-alanine-endopeptidase [Candidatus Mycobacterium methanotrophicum]UQX10630.1 D-alanyl-D-alanine carboxypeptidase/D-alanyl-D-alanine-endopeptidase [Candidatus Mycobacterium methanotrophicum]